MGRSNHLSSSGRSLRSRPRFSDGHTGNPAERPPVRCDFAPRLLATIRTIVRRASAEGLENPLGRGAGRSSSTSTSGLRSHRRPAPTWGAYRSLFEHGSLPLEVLAFDRLVRRVLSADCILPSRSGETRPPSLPQGCAVVSLSLGGAGVCGRLGEECRGSTECRVGRGSVHVRAGPATRASRPPPPPIPSDRSGLGEE